VGEVCLLVSRSSEAQLFYTLSEHLFKTREKFLQDERRRRQFDDSLLRLYQLLFRELLKEKRYRPVLAHALLLCALRQGGHRLLFKSLSLRQLLAATQ